MREISLLGWTKNRQRDSFIITVQMRGNHIQSYYEILEKQSIDESGRKGETVHKQSRSTLIRNLNKEWQKKSKRLAKYQIMFTWTNLVL